MPSCYPNEDVPNASGGSFGPPGRVSGGGTLPSSRIVSILDVLGGDMPNDERMLQRTVPKHGGWMSWIGAVG